MYQDEYQVASIKQQDFISLYQVRSTKYLQKCHLSQNTNPHFFILQSVFSIRHWKKVSSSQYQVARLHFIVPSTKYNVPSSLRTSMLLHTLYFVQTPYFVNRTSYFVLSTWYIVQQKKALRITSKGFNNVAATYSPGCNPSTIGAAGLNFSVRDGKRWDPCARPPKL